MKIIIVPCIPKMVGRRYSFAKTLAEQGHEVHYITWDLPYRLSFSQALQHLKTTLFTKTYAYENFTIHKISRLPFFWPYINGWLFKYQIKKIYNQTDADIIFSQGFTNETEVPQDLPLIYDLNDDHAAMAEIYGSIFYRLAYKLLRVRSAIRRQCRNALAVTVVSDALYEFAKQYNETVFKLPNGVDKAIVEKVKKDRSTHSRKPYSIIYVTGFNQWTRPIETIKAIMRLREDFPAIELTLVGEGTETEKIKKFIKDNNLKSYVHYLGGVYDREKLFGLINQSAVGLSISEKNKYRDAAQPLKVFEYSALGKKVVSTDLEEVKALNLPNVFIFSDNDNKSNLTDAIRASLNSSNHYRKVGSSILKDYSWRGLSKSLSDIMTRSLKA